MVIARAINLKLGALAVVAIALAALVALFRAERRAPLSIGCMGCSCIILQCSSRCSEETPWASFAHGLLQGLLEQLQLLFDEGSLCVDLGR